MIYVFQFRNRRRVISYGLWTVMVLGMLLRGLPTFAQVNTSAELKDGVLDLRGWSFEEDGPVVLEGDWKIWWGALVTGNSTESSSFFRVPGYWNGREINGQKVPGEACATFGLTVHLPPNISEDLGIYLRVAISSTALWARSSAVGPVSPLITVGAPACSRDREIPLWLPKVASLRSVQESGTLTLWWHVSNYHFARGGPLISPVIGNLDELKRDLLFERLRDAVLIGILAIMALYHLGLFSQRTKDKTSLWFGLLCMASAARQISTSRFIEILSEEAGVAQFEIREMLEYGSMCLGLPLSMLFVSSLIPGKFIKLFSRLIVIGCGMYMALIIATPAVTYSGFVNYYQAMLFASMVAFIGHTMHAWSKGSRLAGLTLLGFLPMVIAATNDVLVGKGILDNPFLSPYGFGAMILIQSYILASRFSLAYRTAERLSENLKTEVDHQTRALIEQNEIAESLKVQAEGAKLESDRLRLAAEKHADELRELDRAKTEFFQNMSHELRTPLTLMLLPLERYVSEHHNLPALEMALRNGRRLQRMVNQLLDLQKTEAGKFRYRIVTVNCSSLVSLFAEYFEPAAAGKGVAFTVGVPDGDPLCIMCDVDGLEKIIFNFLSNALKFTPAGGSIRLEVGLEPESGKVRWSVFDTGVGIRLSEQKKVFDVFAQADSSTTREYEGTGLGLALCKTLTEEMGGVIGLTSEVGEGSLFYVEFEPVQPKASAEIIETFEARVWLQPDEVVEHVDHRQHHLRPNPSGENADTRLLVVDDVADMREIIVEVVTSAGYSCSTASDGSEALSVLQKESFDLIISDWMMPTVSGPELVLKLRELENDKQTPVILLTAKSDDTSRYQAFETGADGFLGKPFKPQELIAMIRNLLALKVREQELEELLMELRQTQERMLMQAQLATVGHMAQGLAHEIRNPLNFVKGGAEIIRDDLPEGLEPAPALRLIERGIERIERIIGNIQDLADGRTHGTDSKFKVEELLKSSVEIFELSQNEVGVDLQIECDPALQVSVDESKIAQVILNLLLNAVRAVYDCENPKIILSAKASVDGDKRGLIISVYDNGPGVPEELIDTLFEPFVTQTRDASGTGLGLTISRQIVEAMEGQLELTSNDAGATFEIWLPIKT